MLTSQFNILNSVFSKSLLILELNELSMSRGTCSFLISHSDLDLLIVLFTCFSQIRFSPTQSTPWPSVSTFDQPQDKCAGQNICETYPFQGKGSEILVDLSIAQGADSQTPPLRSQYSWSETKLWNLYFKRILPLTLMQVVGCTNINHRDTYTLDPFI